MKNRILHINIRPRNILIQFLGHESTVFVGIHDKQFYYFINLLGKLIDKIILLVSKEGS